MRRSALVTSILLFAAALAATVPIRAQQSREKVAAEAAFEEARRLMGEGKFADACPKFAESNRLDPGIGVLLYLGDCYEKNGQTASAWAAFREAQPLALAAGQTEREKVARERALQLEAKLSRLAVVVPTSSDVPGLEVRQDGVIVGRALWGSPIPVDPGVHKLEANAPGFKGWTTTVDVHGAAQTVNVPRLEEEHAAEAEPPAAVRPGPSPIAPVGHGLGARRTIGVVASGIGLAGIGVGAVFGGVTISKWNAVKGDPHCHADASSYTCDANGVNAGSAASSSATIADIGLIGGGVALAAGIGLLVLAPSQKSANHGQAGSVRMGITITPNSRGLAVTGTF